MAINICIFPHISHGQVLPTSQGEGHHLLSLKHKASHAAHDASQRTVNIRFTYMSSQIHRWLLSLWLTFCKEAQLILPSWPPCHRWLWHWEDLYLQSLGEMTRTLLLCISGAMNKGSSAPRPTPSHYSFLFPYFIVSACDIFWFIPLWEQVRCLNHCDATKIKQLLSMNESLRRMYYAEPLKQPRKHSPVNKHSLYTIIWFQWKTTHTNDFSVLMHLSILRHIKL